MAEHPSGGKPSAPAGTDVSEARDSERTIWAPPRKPVAATTPPDGGVQGVQASPFAVDPAERTVMLQAPLPPVARSTSEPPGPRWVAPSTAPEYPAVAPPPVHLQGKLDARLVLLAEPDSARASSFRLLRDNLLAKRLPRVLAVSSADKKDGKTTCAVNLALTLAEGARVLLLDGNLFNPALAKIFCIDESATPTWLPGYTVAEFSRGLHIAAIAVRPGAAPPRFDKQSFETLVGSLRRLNYDFMIIDAPALSVSPTVRQLIATADATLLAVRSGETTARALRRATDQIPQGRAIGVALIDAPVTA